MMPIRFLLQTVFSAIAQIWNNKARAMLTTLGIVIGVWAITTVIAAVSSLNTWVLSEFESLGARRLNLWGDVPDSMRGKVSWQDVRIGLDDVAVLRTHATTIESIALQAYLRCTVTHADRRFDGVRVTGIEPDLFDIENRKILSGRPLTMTDSDNRRQVAVINDFAVDELRLEGGGVGEHILINNRRFLVVGVVETQQLPAMFGANESRVEAFIPFDTTRSMVVSPWTEAVVRLAEAGQAEEAREEIRFVLRKHRQLEPEDEDTFEMFILESALDQLRSLGAGLTAGAGVLVGISLLVGGIGIMNIMLVSVSERTREIGLRKALGANPLVVLTQFLVEAIMLCVMGGVVGLILGQATTLGLRAIPDFPFSQAEIPAWAIALAFGFSAGVGVVFGMYPAIKAARLDPIVALRHE
ncbi:MAG: ABC transporter permease [Phycisphaerales bacterium]